MPFAANVEVSFNLGQQYTDSGMFFYYTPQDAISRIYPTEGFVMGNERVKIYTSYFFDKMNEDAACIFSFTSPADGLVHSHLVNVIEIDDTGIVCFHPPAYLLSEELEAQGGTTFVTVSSNGIDFSHYTAQEYLYRLPVVVTDVSRTFVWVDQGSTVQLTG